MAPMGLMGPMGPKGPMGPMGLGTHLAHWARGNIGEPHRNIGKAHRGVSDGWAHVPLWIIQANMRGTTDCRQEVCNQFNELFLAVVTSPSFSVFPASEPFKIGRGRV